MHALGAQLTFQALLTVLEDPEARQSRLVWFHLTSFLHHASMMSKFLTPISKEPTAVARGQALRDALDIDSSSAVLPRDARDNIEHFDDRMDLWLRDSSPNILEIVLDDREDYDYLRVAEKRVKRLLIADELTFVSETRKSTKFELQLRPILEEVERIRSAVNTWMGRSSPCTFVYPGH